MSLAEFMHSHPLFISGLAQFHLLTYSTLLGTEIYQTFLMTRVAHQALPRSAFTTLQKRVFPIYFRVQSFLIIVTAITYPPRGSPSLIRRWTPFAIAGFTAVLNLLVYGPRTRQVMIDRIHQETVDGRKSGGLVHISPEMERLNRAFSLAHAMSIHLNLITIGATIWHGLRLASAMKFHGA